MFKVLHSLSPPPEVSRQCTKSSTRSLLLQEVSRQCTKSSTHSLLLQEVSRQCTKSSTRSFSWRSVGSVQSPPLTRSSSRRSVGSVQSPPLTRSSSRRSVGSIQSPPLAPSHGGQSAVFKAIFLLTNNCLTGTKVTTSTRFFIKMNIKIVQQQFSSAHSGIIHIPPNSNQFMVS